ncbi:MAG: LuxR C-terminal-related transcriptional regulator [bacterium]|jgi:DNA-binding CsgD family transcriptional regulator|nr:PAS domain-containing protein [Phycisphaerales bacterium]MCE2653630.1 LuxR C-terminal-related transcriptional regulator [Planctomycetaceae bacterium]
MLRAFGTATERVRCDAESVGLRVGDAAAFATLASQGEGVFAAAYDGDGRYVWASGSMADAVGMSPEELVGRRMAERFGAAWCEERLGLIRRVLQSGRLAHVVEIFRGRRMESSAYAVSGGPSRFVLMVSRVGVGGALRPSADVEHLLEADWGRLSPLTRCELDVLRLVACGLENGQIASAQHRTKRAVEWHITNLYRMLQCEQRIDLFRVGIFAGFHEIDDGCWSRIVARVPLERQRANATRPG